MRRILIGLLLLPTLLWGQDSSNVTAVYQQGGWQFARAVAVQGNFAYIAAGSHGLAIYDVTSPSEPIERGSYDSPGYAWDVSVAGSFAYLSDGGSGLRVVNISNPDSPAEVGFYDTPGIANGIEISESHAYIADGSSGIRIVNTATPSSPVEIGFFNTPGYAEGVAVAGNYAYVADNLLGLRIIDISIPSSPVEIGSYPLDDFALEVAVAGNFAYVAAASRGLEIINISDPAYPEEVRWISNMFSYALGVAMQGEYAYVAESAHGLRVIRVSDWQTAAETGFYDTPGQAQCVSVVGNYAYVADYTHFGIYDCSAAMGTSPNPIITPSSFSLSSIYPNPFNSATTIQFELPRQSDVEMNVFDVQGRLTRELANRVFTAGSHSYMFDAQGLPSGSYFVKMNADGFQAVKKVVLLK